MSYAEKRKERIEAEQNQDVLDYNWEEQSTQLLHSGFIEPTTQDPTKSTLSLHVYFDSGRYWCRLEDREAGEQAFTTVLGLQNLFEELEKMLQTDMLVFRKLKTSKDRYQSR